MGKITFLQQLNPIVNSLRDLLPIILVVAFFQLVVLNKPIPNYSQLLIGTISVIIGLALFIRGLELALFPGQIVNLWSHADNNMTKRQNLSTCIKI